MLCIYRGRGKCYGYIEVKLSIIYVTHLEFKVRSCLYRGVWIFIDKAVTLYREVVLVTDDRNLRLKAHTRNVPVKDLIQFMEWAGIHCGTL